MQCVLGVEQCNGERNKDSACRVSRACRQHEAGGDRPFNTKCGRGTVILSRILLRPQFHAVQDLSEFRPCSRVVVPTRVDDFHQFRCRLSWDLGASPGQHAPDNGPRVEVRPWQFPSHYFPRDYPETVDIAFEGLTLVIEHL